MLIEEGLDVADANNAKTYIEASPKGVQLYLRHGWKQVDDILIDVGKFGEQGACRVRSALLGSLEGNRIGCKLPSRMTTIEGLR